MKESRHPSNITIHGSIAKIELCGKGKEIKAIALIDSYIVGKVRKYRWHMDKGYVCTCEKTNHSVTSHRLHHFLLPKKPGFVVDHIDRNRLNNTLSNLRYVTFSENCRNRSLSSINSTGVKGVSYNSRDDLFHAYITFDGKRKTIGYFKSLDCAYKARMAEEIRLFGEFSIHNGHQRRAEIVQAEVEG